MKMIWTTSKIKAKVKCCHFDRKDDGASKEMERGSIIHSILEKNGDYENIDLSCSVYRGERKPYQHQHNLEEYKEIAEKTMEKYPEFLGYDAEVELSYEDTNYILSGICDRIHIDEESKEAQIVDWKTGFTRASIKDELDMMQSFIYAYIVLNLYKVHTVTFSFIYIDSDDDKVVINFKDSDKEKLKKIIDKWIFLAENKGLETGQHCSYCKNRDTCSLLAENMDKYKKIGNYDMADLKAMKKVLDARIEDIRNKWLEDGDLDKFSVATSYYINIDEADKDKFYEIMEAENRNSVMKKKGKVKITKKLAQKLREQGFDVIEEQSYKLKSR